VKTLLDEELLGRFLDPAFILFDRVGLSFSIPPIKNERPDFINLEASLKV